MEDLKSYKLSKTSLIVGLSLIILGLVLNEWLLSLIFSQDHVLEFTTRCIIWTFDIVMILIGGYIIILKNNIRFKKICFTILLLMISVFLIEVTLNICLLIHEKWGGGNRGSKPEIINGLDVTIYSDDSWIYQYVNELSSIKNDIYFWLHKNKSFSGRTININDDGTRRTWNPDYSSLDHAGKIFVFGGSTCLGTGARDFYTIPSFISKYLHNGGYKYKVYNYGQSAFTFKQELFYLIYLLRDGFHPDIVIFYDGINDIYSTYQSGKVVVNQNYETVNEKIRFNHNIFNYVKSSFELFLKNYIWNSKIITAFNKIRRNIKKDDETSLQVHSKFSDTEIKILSREIINEYLRSLELLDKISKLYNFKYLNFWQPSLFTEKVIFEEEDKDGFGQIRSHDNSCKKLFVNCQRLVEQKFYGKIVDISQVFDQRDKPYYLDVLHVTEEANSIIADSIYQELISREIVSFSD